MIAVPSKAFTASFSTSFDYNAIPAMKTEARQRLNRVRPATIGQAARIPGITPADIALLLVHVKKGE